MVFQELETFSTVNWHAFTQVCEVCFMNILKNQNENNSQRFTYFT